jgi:hypothetical protein
MLRLSIESGCREELDEDAAYPSRRSHSRLGLNAAIHQSRAFGLAILLFDVGQKLLQCRLVRGVAVHDFVRRAQRFWLRPAPSASNASLSTFEPVSSRTAISCRERVWRGRRLGRHFCRRRSISHDRDWVLSLFPRQSPGKLKTIPLGPGRSQSGKGVARRSVITRKSVRPWYACELPGAVAPAAR